MSKIYTFFRLSRQEQRLLCSSGLLVIAIRLGLWVLPFRYLQHLLDIFGQRSVRWASQVDIARIPWAVGVTSHHVPMATCLTQALSVQTLFRQRGIPCELRIGVAKDHRNQLTAHAWIEYEGQVIIGGSQASVARYVALPSLEHNQR